MSSNSEYSEGDTLKDALFDNISQIQSAGSFAAFGEIEKFVHPGISIDPVGVVGLPLSQEDAQALIQKSHQAPFGDGSKTVVDASVRRTWEIDGTAINFLNPKWQKSLDQIVERVTHELGIAGGPKNIRAELYKMLLYEKGAMFKSHKDTEKTKGMFGTLVICLPSKHDGGTVCLEHKQKRRRLDTSEFSAFGTTYLAWYADVYHEIEPVQSGYRWVLTYNLINDSRDQNCSASELDSRIHDLAGLLTQWGNLDNPYQCLVYPLEHQYTNKSLRLALLKGNDSCRARHAVQSCEEHSQFCVFLGNMELCVKDFQDEDEYTESELSLTRVVDTNGFDLMIHRSKLQISESALLQHVYDEGRDPDVQRGGGYLGNQHGEIDQLYQDSVMILIPKRHVLAFLMNNTTSVSALGNLIGRSTERVASRGHDQASKEFLFQICQSARSVKWANAKDKDFALGYIAVAAAFLPHSPLFIKAVDRTIDAFAPDSYFELGKLIRLQVAWEDDASTKDISEDDFIRALTSSKTLHTTYGALKNFQGGFLQANPDRERMVPKDYVKRWIDSIAMDYLNRLQSVSELDASTLVEIILDRGDNDFRQNLLYQGIRTLLKKFNDEKKFLIALMIKLFVHLPESGSSHKYLRSLLRQILDVVVSGFDFKFYAQYVKTDLVRDSALKKNAGPIGTFYQSVDDHGRTTLLDKFKTQALSFPEAQARDFLPVFLEELLNVVDTSSSEVQECMQSLVDTYIMLTVGKEPVEPSDWSRPQEVVSDGGQTCDCLRQLKDFLLDPEASTYELSCPKNNGYCHVGYYFSYMDKETVGDKATFSKTLRWWKEAHKKWDRCAREAVSALRKLPQEKLTHCLANQYDETMDLRKIKIGYTHSKGTVSPSKRVWTDD